MVLVRSSSPTQTVILHGETDVGMVREENQDAFGVHLPEDQEKGRDRGALLILADGMGGLACGGTASQMAVRIIHEVYYQSEGEFSSALVEAVKEANRQIFKEAQGLPGNQPMGSTVTALSILEGRALVAQVGDSRAYRISKNDGIKQLTRDHTLVQELAERGEIEPDSIQYFLHRNVLTRGLGLQEEVEVDLVEVPDLKPGDTFLVCSDGLYDMVDDKEMENLVMAHGAGLVELVDNLLDLARSRGAPDNVTVVVARLETDETAALPVGTLAAQRAPSAAGTGGSWRFPRNLVTPLSYFFVFALAVFLTLHFHKPNEPATGSTPNNPESGSVKDSVDRILQDPELQEYFNEAEGGRLKEELNQLLKWLEKEREEGKPASETDQKASPPDAKEAPNEATGPPAREEEAPADPDDPGAEIPNPESQTPDPEGGERR